MISLEFEKMLIQFCAPTLLGLKAASLISVSRGEMPDLFAQIARCNRTLGACGLRFSVLCECNRRNLVYVYRPALLEKRLADVECRALLARWDYPVEEGIGQMLLHLRGRIARCSDFPHEIGLFLDYPIPDVAAFIENAGADCKLCGYWKVYCDVESAKACFARYDACRAHLMAHFAAGNTISTLLTAG